MASSGSPAQRTRVNLERPRRRPIRLPRLRREDVNEEDARAADLLPQPRRKDGFLHRFPSPQRLPPRLWPTQGGFRPETASRCARRRWHPADGHGDGHGITLRSFRSLERPGIPFRGRPDAAFGADSKHWFNHLLCSPNGRRLFFLHRWRGPKDGASFHTRAFTVNSDGTEPYVLSTLFTACAFAYFVWRDPEHVFAFAWHPSHGDRFYLYEDRTENVTVVGKDVMTQNGHQTYVPGTGGNPGLLRTTPTPIRTDFSTRTSITYPAISGCRWATSPLRQLIVESGAATTTLVPVETATPSCSTLRTTVGGKSTSSISRESFDKCIGAR